MQPCKDCVHYGICTTWAPGVEDVPAELNCSFFKDKALTIDLPCKIGTHLWRVTYPYRQEPKVTEYVVKNFRTVGKKHQLQIEVQALNVPGTNWMKYKDFCTTYAEAERIRQFIAETQPKGDKK